MNHLLDLKIRQMHHALGAVKSHDLSGVAIRQGTIKGSFYSEVDFSGGMSDAELYNAVSLLLANIGSIRDHFKNWCLAQGVEFEGDRLINSSLACGIIHDLWNTDKHGHLTRPPRSGHRVRLGELHKGVNLTTGAHAGAWARLSWNPFTGEMTTSSSVGGDTTLVISGPVLSEDGTVLGDLSALAEQAVADWEVCLKKAGAMA